MRGRALRVAMVHGPGSTRHDGVSDYVARLVETVPNHEVQVRALAVRPGRRGGWWAGVARVAGQLRRWQPDVVHVQFAPSAYRFTPALGTLPLLLPRGTTLVTTVHEYGWWAVPGWLPPAAWRPLERWGRWDRETGRLVPASGAVVVTNAGHGTQVRRRTGVRTVEIPLAPNVTVHPPAPDVRARVRRELRLPPQACLLVFFGFVHPVKGVRYAVEALPAVRAHRSDVHLVVAGGFTSQALPEPAATAYREELDGLVRRLGVTDAVTFTGHLPAARISALLHAGDVGVLPFTHGVTVKSGALLAALAHGLPTAVTAADDPDPALQDGRTVAVIPARRDAAAVAATVRRLLVDDSRRARLAAGGRAVAAGRSWDGVAARHRALYAEVRGCGDG
ncbi:MAG TPA: glycosyltransferase family 4 protein [Kineosporiaceae bacterium]